MYIFVIVSFNGYNLVNKVILENLCVCCVVRKQSTETSKDQRNDKKTTMATSPNSSISSMSSLSSADTVDFLTGPRSVASDEEIEPETSLEEQSVQSPVYEEDEVNPPELPPPSTLKPKSKPKPKPKQKPKHNRKQEKPAKKKDRILNDIRDLQNTTNFLISKAPFQRYPNDLLTTNSIFLFIS